MIKRKNFLWRERAASFKYAWCGVVSLFINEHNSRIHLVAALLTIGCGVWLNISSTEWIAVVLCIAAVIAMESMNSAIEAICDKVSPQNDKLIGMAKDYAAAAVLIVSIAAAVVGFIIFVPKILALWGCKIIN